ncbi:PIN domain-containing protein, partial [Photobacterium phosphoreum]|uniref:PIN domain-containing protein n=1 Tax=Photobacterium phosphoreum TaxID=659 RepID=UPI001E65374A
LGLAQQGVFQPVWSPIIADEWQRNAAKIWDVAALDIQQQWQQLNHEFPNADQGDVQAYKVGLLRSDPKDWHVIAAARAAMANAPAATVGILTRNTKDFNRSELRSLGISLFDPDTFFVRCWDLHPEKLIALIQDMAVYAQSINQPVVAVDVVLKRERLFRLNRLYTGRA